MFCMLSSSVHIGSVNWFPVTSLSCVIGLNEFWCKLHFARCLSVVSSAWIKTDDVWFCWTTVGWCHTCVADRSRIQCASRPLQSSTSNKLPSQPPLPSGMGWEMGTLVVHEKHGSRVGPMVKAWLSGVVVCLHAALLVHLSINAGSGWLHNVLWYH